MLSMSETGVDAIGLFRAMGQAGWSDQEEAIDGAVRGRAGGRGGRVGAYVPDLPGCVATGATAAEVSAHIRGAIVMHLEGMAEDEEPAPRPTSAVEYVEVEVGA